MTLRGKPPSPALAYALLLPEIQKAGREVGYAVAAHGSLARDLDVVAVPWTEEAVSAERLVLHLLAALDGRLLNGATRNADGTWTDAPASVPSAKPHGRLAWSLHVGNPSLGLYVDVSVMPRSAATSGGCAGRDSSVHATHDLDAAHELDERQATVPTTEVDKTAAEATKAMAEASGALGEKGRPLIHEVSVEWWVTAPDGNVDVYPDEEWAVEAARALHERAFEQARRGGSPPGGGDASEVRVRRVTRHRHTPG